MTEEDFGFETQAELRAPYLMQMEGTGLSVAERELVADACIDLEIESRFDPALLALIIRLSTPELHH